VDTWLKARGARLSAGWSIRMPGNYPLLAGPPSQKEQQRLFADAEKQIAGIADIVKRGETAPLQDSFALLRGLARLMNPMAVSFFAKADKKFVVKDNCTKCGVCEKVCPVQNITLIDGKPFWLHHCEQCMACLQWCPVEAIQAGRITEGRKRYQHPRFKAQDFFLEK
jgi:NAD-dependent dihydropyrimidine dehydrogenase PreA subunit